MIFINRLRNDGICRIFVDVDQKKMFMISHKCGLAIYEHLFMRTYRQQDGFIQPITQVHQIGPWHIIIQNEELDSFLEEFDETEFSKLMITRNPYDRLLSFYTNSFWDFVNKLNYAEEKPPHYRAYRQIYGEDYDAVVEQTRTHNFQHNFNTFLDAMFVDPTPGALEHRQTRGGHGNIHLIPQSAKYRRGDKRVLSDIQFVDLRDGIPTGKHKDKVLDFLGVEDIIREPMNVSSGTQRRAKKRSWEYFSPEALKVVNEVYHFDFVDLGYGMRGD